MNRLLTALTIPAALMSPAFAQGVPADVACSAFLTMSHDDQMAAMAAAMTRDTIATKAAMATEGTMVTDGTVATAAAMISDAAMAAMVKMCATRPDMTLMDAMHSMN